MKNLKTMEIIEKWAKDFNYKWREICIAKNDEWIIIEISSKTIIMNDTEKLMKDIKKYWSNGTLNSIDSLPNDEGLSIWIQL